MNEAEHLAEVRRWLRYASDDLRAADIYLGSGETAPHIVCWHAQQAAEKAIKALLIKKGIAFPYVHDIAHLLTLLEQTELQIPEPVRRAEDLTRYAVVTRYPGIAEPVGESHYRDALVSAEAVVRWAEREIG